LLVLVVFVFAQTVVAIAYIVVLAIVRHDRNLLTAESIATDGMLVGLATIASTPIVAGLVLLLVKIRKGPSLRDYLGLHWPDMKTSLAWLLGMAVFLAASDGLSLALGRPLIPEVMVKIYRNTSFLPVLWFALVIGAPLGEEILFRGFLFRGLRDSRLGGPGAIVVSSVMFASIHLQYGPYDMAAVGLTGVVLACARLRTGSLLLCMAMHALANLWASLEVALLM
jgi:membrane protease YdiL (CAAX protease family)